MKKKNENAQIETKMKRYRMKIKIGTRLIKFTNWSQQMRSRNRTTEFQFHNIIDSNIWIHIWNLYTCYNYMQAHTFQSLNTVHE